MVLVTIDVYSLTTRVCTVHCVHSRLCQLPSHRFHEIKCPEIEVAKSSKKNWLDSA